MFASITLCKLYSRMTKKLMTENQCVLQAHI